MYPPKLSIELVPKTCWFSNVRSEVSAGDWDKIKKVVAAKAGNRCEICGGRGPKWPVECHEIWSYDDVTHVQKLERMIALCPACHEVKHIGLAQTRGRFPQAIAHLMDVNGWEFSAAQAYVNQAFRLWASRSAARWTLDISHLDQYGVTPKGRSRDR